MSGEEMGMMGEDQEAVEWRRPEQHSSASGTVSTKNQPAQNMQSNHLIVHLNSSLVFLHRHHYNNNNKKNRVHLTNHTFFQHFTYTFQR